MLRYISLFVLLIFFTGCGEDSKHKKYQEFYSTNSQDISKFFIQTTAFNNNYVAIINAINIRNNTHRDVFIDTLGKQGKNEKFVVLIGTYDDAYSAGKDAFNLHNKRILSDYTLVRNKNEVIDPFVNLIFIALHNNMPALYNYNILTNESRLFWQIKDEKIIELSSARNQNYSFAITAARFGQSISFPFINKAKLYHLSVQDQTIREIYSFGNGIQLYAFWITPNLYKVTFNYLHESIANSVVEQSIVFNFSGNILSEETKFYDLVKEDYPYPPVKALEISSPNNDFTIIEETKDTESVYYLRVNSTQKRNRIYVNNQNLRKVEWSDNNQFVVFSTSNIYSKSFLTYPGSPDSSQIAVFSLEKNKITKLWKTSGNKNFFLRGDIIFLDYHSGTESYILVYDYRNDREVVSIKKAGGCGFSFLPQLSDNGEQ